MNYELVLADYSNEQHGKDIGFLMDCYASDAMGGSKPLTENIRSSLASALAKVPQAFSLIFYVNNKPAGLVNCIEVFSTFNCKPLMNIHDVVVAPDFRGKGISTLMLSKVEEISIDKGCCKITLEVLEGNYIAQNSYKKSGFSDYVLDPEMGRALFWQKII